MAYFADFEMVKQMWKNTHFFSQNRNATKFKFCEAIYEPSRYSTGVLYISDTFYTACHRY